MEIYGDTIIAGNMSASGGLTASMLYASGSDEVQLLIGTNRLFVSRSGVVGVGTATPKAALQIGNATAIGNTVAPSGNGSVFGFNTYKSSSVYSAIATGNRSGYLEFTNSGVKLRLSSGTQTADIQLSTIGSIWEADVGTLSLTVPTGNLGVGAGAGSTPIGLLTVASASIGTPMNIYFANTAATTTNNEVRLRFAPYNAQLSPLYASYLSVIETDGAVGQNDMMIGLWDGVSVTERMRISSSGNVGIGTTTPTTKLNVVETAAGVTTARFDGNYNALGTVNVAEFRRGGGAVASAIRYNDASTDMSMGTITSHRLNWMINGTNKVTITTGGNVGIWTTASNMPLEILTGNSSLGIRINRFLSGVYYSDIIHTTYPDNSMERLAFSVGNGSSIKEVFSMKADGTVSASGAISASGLVITTYAATASTANSGVVQATPATTAGYLVVNISGTDFKIPLYRT